MKKTIIMVALVCCMVGCSSNGSSVSTSHIYDSAKEIEQKNNSGEVVSTTSVSKAKESDVTMDSLTDWYFNYVSEYDHDSDFIVYTDSDGYGVYSAFGSIYVGAKLTEESDGSYSVTEEDALDNATVYYADSETNTLLTWEELEEKMKN